MNFNIFLFLHLILTLNCFGQNVYLKISGKNDTENKIIDSIGYAKMLTSKLSIAGETTTFKEKLEKIGFLENNEIRTLTLNDSLIEVQFDLRKQLKKCSLNIGEIISEDTEFSDLKRHRLYLNFAEIEFYIDKRRNQLEKEGFSQSKIKLSNLKIINDTLFADMDITLNQKRKIDGIEIKGLTKFPKGHLKNLMRSYNSKLFSKKELENIKIDVEQYEFVKQIKYPEILFTKDSTKVFLYLEKKVSNTFDGFIGFGNDEVSKKVKLNGFVDLNLVNIINQGEKIGLLWKSDGKDQKTLSVGVEIPFLLKTPFGLRTKLNIFRQDSIFQNTKIGLEVNHALTQKSKIVIGYQSETSSVIKNNPNSTISDFDNKFFTTALNFESQIKKQSIVNEKNSAEIKMGFGNRKTPNQSENQIFTKLIFKKYIFLNTKNSVELKSENYFLKSSKIIQNELYRFGGFGSVRGFSENSLQGNVLASIMTEYRYQLTSGLLINTILDYGYLEDKANETKNKLLGIGFGLKILTKNGLLNLIYANGTTDNEIVKLSNSIIHVSLKTNF